MPVEINLPASIDAAEVLPECHVPLVADCSEGNQANRVSPMLDVVTGPTDHVDANEHCSADPLFLVIPPNLVPVESLVRTADHALTPALLDYLLPQLSPTIVAEAFRAGA
jgi:hypothetical protein